MTDPAAPAPNVERLPLGATTRHGILLFTAPHCSSCRTVRPILADRAAATGVEWAEVPADRAPHLARQFGVRAAPTIVAVSAGRELGRLTGAAPRQAIEELCELVRAGAGEAPPNRPEPSLVALRGLAGITLVVAGMLAAQPMLLGVGAGLGVWMAVSLIRRGTDGIRDRRRRTP